MVELTGVGRVTNGCGDEIMRLVVNGRFVVVENVVYAGNFVVVGIVDLIKGSEVVEMTGIDGDFVVIFGTYVDVVSLKSSEKKTNFNIAFALSIYIAYSRQTFIGNSWNWFSCWRSFTSWI